MRISWPSVLVLGVFIVIALAPSPGMAGDAFFSQDGRTVTIGLGNALPGLVKIDLDTGMVTEAPLPAELQDEYIDSVARGAEGETLFLAKDAVWVWVPGAATPVRRVCATAPVEGASDLFVATAPGTPLTDYLFITGWESDDTGGSATFFGRKPGGKKFAPIFCRRVADARGGVFSAKGRLFFTSNGDLWEGGIQKDDDDSGMERIGTLVGARIAPLAISNTDEGNSGSLFVRNIAPAGGWIYSQISGRHMAAILRSPMPASPLFAPNQGEFPTVKAQLDAMKESLNKAEIIADDLDEVFGFCAIEVDGPPRVFFCTRTGAEGKGPAMMLWEGVGKPRPIAYFPAE